MEDTINVAKGEYMPHTVSTAVAAGDVHVVGNIVGVVLRDVTADDITLGRKALLQIEGVVDVPKVTGAINQGALVYWDEDGSPVSGSATTGAAVTYSSGNELMGICFEAAGSSDETVKVKLTYATA